ncbi:hypothetical protein VPH35_037017 [Triticum aestivum]
MVKVQPASARMSAFQQAQEEQQYNLFLMKQHRLAQGQIDGERASEEAVVAIAAASLNFVVERSGRRGGAAARCRVGEQPQLRLLHAAAELSGGLVGRRQRGRHHFHRGSHIHRQQMWRGLQG